MTTPACDECGKTAPSVARIGAVTICAPCLLSGATPAYEKAICYDPETRDFAMFLGGELVGYARTYSDAEATLDELIYELLTRHPEVFIEPAA